MLGHRKFVAGERVATEEAIGYSRVQMQWFIVVPLGGSSSKRRGSRG
jgi:hypothetical protein